MSSSAMRAVNGVIGSTRSDLPHRRGCQLGVGPQGLPLLGVLGEQPHGLGELGLGGVHAADQHVEHEVDQLVVVEPVALVAGGEQGGDEVLARVVAAALEQLGGPVVELLHRLLDLRALLHQGGGVELALDPVRPVVQPGRVLQRRAHHRGDDHRGVGLGEGVDELAAARAVQLCPQALEDLAHRRPPAVGRARRERRVDQVAQPAVVLAVEVEDVAADLLGQRPLVDLEDLGDLQAREGGRPGAQEERARLAVEHGVARAGPWPASPARAGRPAPGGSGGRAASGRRRGARAGRARRPA